MRACECRFGRLDFLIEGEELIPWQMLPRQMGCGSESTCWRRLVRWQRAGIWQRLHETLLAELRRRGRLDQRWTVIDSESVRVPLVAEATVMANSSMQRTARRRSSEGSGTPRNDRRATAASERGALAGPDK